MRQFLLIPIIIIIVCALTSKAYSPSFTDLVLADTIDADTVKIIDRPDIVKPFAYEEYFKDTTYNLNLPLVAIKNEKLKSKLSSYIMHLDNTINPIENQYLYMDEWASSKGKMYSIWQLGPYHDCPTDISKYSIGYCQIDSTYVLVDVSALSRVKIIKGYNKEFTIKVGVLKPPFFSEPVYIYIGK